MAAREPRSGHGRGGPRTAAPGAPGDAAEGPGPAPPPAERGPLRTSLVAGAVYDLALGIFIVLGGPGALAALGHPPPEPVFLLYLSGLPLFLLPALYLAAARAADPDPFRAPVLWARGGGGALVILFAVLFPPPGAWIYLAVGAADLLWAAVHAALWSRGRQVLGFSHG